jgi:DNA repair exonuclease SbcCD ATPase subunit
MDEQRFKEMKRGLGQFSKGAKMMKNHVGKVKNQLAKCGVGLPIELTNALDAADGIIAKIQAAENADALEEAIGDIEDVGSVMQEWGPKMGDLMRICGMMKQAEKDLKQMLRDVARVEKQAKGYKKADLSELVAQLKQEVETLQNTLAQAKELAKTDPEAALEKLEDEFYGQMDNVRNARTAIEMAINISRGLKEAARELKSYEQQIKKFKRMKLDTSEAEQLLATLKGQVNELKQLVGTKGFDPEELVSKVEEAFETRERLSDALDALRGGSEFIPMIQGGKGVEFDLPEAFRRQGPSGGEMDGGPEGGFGPGPGFGPSGGGGFGGGPEGGFGQPQGGTNQGGF